MRRDFDRQLNELSKQSLKVKGQEFVLDAQTKIIKEQTQKLKANEKETTEEMQGEKFRLHTIVKENTKSQIAFEGEMRDLTRNMNNAEDTHKQHKIHQVSEKKGDEEHKSRHDQEVQLMTDLKNRKIKEKEDLEKDLA